MRTEKKRVIIIGEFNSNFSKNCKVILNDMIKDDENYNLCDVVILDDIEKIGYFDDEELKLKTNIKKMCSKYEHEGDGFFVLNYNDKEVKKCLCDLNICKYHKDDYKKQKSIKELSETTTIFRISEPILICSFKDVGNAISIFTSNEKINKKYEKNEIKKIVESIEELFNNYKPDIILFAFSNF
jgi:hypothetical protein